MLRQLRDPLFAHAGEGTGAGRPLEQSPRPGGRPRVRQECRGETRSSGRAAWSLEAKNIRDREYGQEMSYVDGLWSSVEEIVVQAACRSVLCRTNSKARSIRSSDALSWTNT